MGFLEILPALNKVDVRSEIRRRGEQFMPSLFRETLKSIT